MRDLDWDDLRMFAVLAKAGSVRQAAELLQVSRTHLVQLLDEGSIPCRKVGSHRRVRLEDILAHRRKTESRRREALDELTARDQELGLQ